MPTFAIILAAFTLSQFYRSFLAVVSADVARDLGLDAAALGNVSAAWFAAFAVAQFPVGYALDRYGPRLTLASVTLVAFAGAVCLSVATGYAGALAGMALIGIGCAPALMAGMYIFARDYPPERFAVLSGTTIGLAAAGNLLGTSPLALAAERFGWRLSIGAIGCLTAACAAGAWAVLRDPPRTAASAADRSILGGLGTIARIRPLWLILPLTAAGYAIVIATRSLWIAPYLASVHGLDAAAIGHVALGMALAMALGSLAYGALGQRLGLKRLVTAGTAATAAWLLALGLWGGASVTASVLLLASAGATGMTYAIVMAHALQFMPATLVGRGVTFMNFAFVGGAGLIQWASGRFVQASLDAGAAPATIYARLFLAFAAVLAAALAVYAFAPASPKPGARP